jgi:2-polyprenyl-6-methoxyphenol hydroxylase-like FAD-dependent oxidoreductase
MALAYLLARRGVEVTVVEAHHDFARAFRGEGLQQSGIDAFRQMGLAEQFDRIPHVEVRTLEIYSSGRLVVCTDPAGLGRGGTPGVSAGAPGNAGGRGKQISIVPP